MCWEEKSQFYQMPQTPAWGKLLTFLVPEVLRQRLNSNKIVIEPEVKKWSRNALFCEVWFARKEKGQLQDVNFRIRDSKCLYLEGGVLKGKPGGAEVEIQDRKGKMEVR